MPADAKKKKKKEKKEKKEKGEKKIGPSETSTKSPVLSSLRLALQSKAGGSPAGDGASGHTLRWRCLKCNAKNKLSRGTCRKCEAEKPTEIGKKKNNKSTRLKTAPEEGESVLCTNLIPLFTHTHPRSARNPCCKRSPKGKVCPFSIIYARFA